jgi:hypothetical protein
MSSLSEASYIFLTRNLKDIGIHSYFPLSNAPVTLSPYAFIFSNEYTLMMHHRDYFILLRLYFNNEFYKNSAEKVFRQVTHLSSLSYHSL